ncbi:MAG: hypothetical protein ACREIG_03415, partial [Nitrospiraceae bacterium]
LCTLLIQGCSPYESRHQNQWNSREQIWLSEASQLKVRAAQTRAFDTTDHRRMFEAIISTMQDLNFSVELLDEELGIISGKKFVEIEDSMGTDPSYLLYRPDTLLLLTRNVHAWGPFRYRSNLVRFTATIRNRGESQLVVRTSAQFYLQAVEEPGPYQQFFRALEQALFLQGISVE